MARNRHGEYLQPHGNGFRVRIPVASHLQDIIGKKNLYAQLKSRTKDSAKRESHSHIADLMVVLEKAEAALNTKDPIIAEALRWRLNIKPSLKSKRTPQSSGPPVSASDIDWDEVEYDDEFDGMIDRAYQIEAKEGRDKAQIFSDIASGAQTPIFENIEGFLTF